LRAKIIDFIHILSLPKYIRPVQLFNIVIMAFFAKANVDENLWSLSYSLSLNLSLSISWLLSLSLLLCLSLSLS